MTKKFETVVFGKCFLWKVKEQKFLFTIVVIHSHHGVVNVYLSLTLYIYLGQLNKINVIYSTRFLYEGLENRDVQRVSEWDRLDYALLWHNYRLSPGPTLTLLHTNNRPPHLLSLCDVRGYRFTTTEEWLCKILHLLIINHWYFYLCNI